MMLSSCFNPWQAQLNASQRVYDLAQRLFVISVNVYRILENSWPASEVLSLLQSDYDFLLSEYNNHL